MRFRSVLLMSPLTAIGSNGIATAATTRNSRAADADAFLNVLKGLRRGRERKGCQDLSEALD